MNAELNIGLPADVKDCSSLQVSRRKFYGSARISNDLPGRTPILGRLPAADIQSAGSSPILASPELFASLHKSRAYSSLISAWGLETFFY